MGKNPKMLTTFLSGFNVGTFFTLISLVEILMTRPSFYEYFIILAVILANGIVIGVVNQYLLIQIHLTKNMGRAFYQAGEEIPKRLLEMRAYHVEKTLELMVGISARIKMNLMLLGGLVVLLLLSLGLPIAYCYTYESKMLWFNIGWSMTVWLYMMRLIWTMIKHSRYVQLKINDLLNTYQFNNVHLKKEKF